MSEDGGPYADSIGSNNLTAANTPTQAAGLVERSDSGMSANMVRASDQWFYAEGTPNATSGLTVSAWVRLDTNNTAYIFQASNNAATGWQRILFNINDVPGNGMGTTIYDVDYGSILTFYEGTNTLVGSWDHYVWVLDPVAETVQQYKNGATAGSGTWAGSTPYLLDTKWLHSDSSSGVNGQTDMLAVWTAVKDATFVSNLYNAGAGTFYASAWGDMIHNGPYYASADPIMLQPLRYPPPSSRRFYIH